MKFFLAALCMFVAQSSSFAGDAKSTPPASSSVGDWEFSLSAGPAWRQSGELGFTGGSRSAGIFIPSFTGSDSLTEPLIGKANEIGDRTYDDGFVRRDGGTVTDGFATHWGYQNSTQVSGDHIDFHATGFQSIRSDTRTPGTAPDFRRNEQSIIPVLDFSGTYDKEFYGFRPGFSASLAWSPVKLDRHWSDFALSQTRDDFRRDWLDRYNLGGVGDQIPAAPYSGSATSPGFALENIPDLRESTIVKIGSENAAFTNKVSTRFRADHTAISFGPTLDREINKSWQLQAGAGVSVHWLRWSAKQKETLSVTQSSGTTQHMSWQDSADGNNLLYGIYLQLGAEWTPEGKDWSIKSFFRSDFGNEFSDKIGPSRLTYDVDGYTAAVMFSHAL